MLISIELTIFIVLVQQWLNHLCGGLEKARNYVKLNILISSSSSCRSSDGNSSVRDIVGRTLQVPQGAAELLGLWNGFQTGTCALVSLSNLEIVKQVMSYPIVLGA